jgi:hypothetical protein
VPLGEVAPGTANTHLITQANYDNCEDSGNTDCIGANGHYKSCKVYVPDYKVMSVRDAGSNQVRVELDRRLSYNEDAPSTIADNATSRAAYIAADSTGSTNGGYRTDENAVVDYLNTFIDGSGTECGQRIGDMAPDADSTSGWSTSEINGSCMPRFYFTRLIPYVYEDNNADYDTTDTLAKTDELTWMESILRAICEGYIDEDSSNTQRKYTDPNTGLTACHNKRLYDWTFEQLMYSANKKQHYRALPKTVRSDEVRGFGPQPSMLTYADHFNQLAEAVNLLTRARIYLPVSFQYKHYNYLSETLLSVSTNASTANCSTGAVWADNVVPTTNYSLDTFDANWRDSAYPTGNAYQQCRIDADSAGNCILKCEKRDVHYRFALTDEALNSLPADLRTLVDTNTALGFGAIDENQTLAVSKTQVSAGSGYGSAGGTNGVENDYVHESKYWDWTNTHTPGGASSAFFEGDCVVTTGGILEASAPPTSDYVDTDDTGNGSFAWNKRNITATDIQAFVEVPYTT